MTSEAGIGRKPTSRRIGIVLAIALAVGVAAYPLFAETTFALNRVELLLVYLMAAISLNLAFGYSGMLLIGQAALLTVAGYTAGILSVRYGWDFWLTTPIAIAAAILVSVFLALPDLRVRGWYLGVIGFLGVAVVPGVVTALDDITGGFDGLPGIARPAIGEWDVPRWLIYELFVLGVVGSWIALRNLIKSGWGVTLLVHRDHPFAAVSSGVNPWHLRWAVYVLTGIPCGLAGALYAHSQQFISSSNFTIHTVLLLVGSVLLGSRGTLWGPVLGVAVFGGLSFWLGTFSQYNALALGVGVLATAVLFPGGLIKAGKRYWETHAARKTDATPLLTEGQAQLDIPPMQRSTRIEVSDVTIAFGGNTALDRVSLTAEGGSVTAVIGANGSGKTTLLNAISGFVNPDSGQVLLDGLEVGDAKRHERASLGIARTFQVPQLVDELTVLQNVELGVFGLNPQTVTGALFRTPRYRSRETEAAVHALAACEALGFSERAIYGKASQLTLALKHMVEMARALAADASVICLDEPVAGLNQVAQEKVATVIRELARSGRTVLLIEHNLPFVLSVSTQMILLKEGKVVDEGAPLDAKDLSRPLGQYFQTFAASTERPEIERVVKAIEATEAITPN